MPEQILDHFAPSLSCSSYEEEDDEDMDYWHEVEELCGCQDEMISDGELFDKEMRAHMIQMKEQKKNVKRARRPKCPISLMLPETDSFMSDYHLL